MLTTTSWPGLAGAVMDACVQIQIQIQQPDVGAYLLNG
jgi:hypothetical protein